MPMPQRFTSKLTTTFAVFYDGSNVEDVRELAGRTGQQLAGHPGPLRVWSDSDDDIRHLLIHQWVVIDHNDELATVADEEFMKLWTVEGEVTIDVQPQPEVMADTPIVEGSLPQAPPSYAPENPPGPPLEEPGSVADAPSDDPGSGSDDVMVAVGAPGPDATKNDWVEYRGEQGYAKSAISKLSKAVLMALPDEVPT